MARNDNVAIPALTWTQLTNANATAIRVQSVILSEMTLQATNGTTAPTTQVGVIVLAGGAVLAADLTIAQLWPGVTGANRVWAFARTPSVASVSHADA
jgi:hypothetical protein